MELQISNEDLYQYIDQDVLLVQPRTIYRLDTHSDGRYYYAFDDDGNLRFYVSNTTFCGRVLPTAPFLIDWFKDKGAMADLIRDASADYGTLLHICIARVFMGGYDFDATNQMVEAYLREKGIPLVVLPLWSTKINKGVASFIQFCIDKEVEPILTEGMLASDKMEIAGTIDLICRMTFNRKRVLAHVDVKSGGAYESSGLQLTIGNRIFEENFPHLKVDMKFNWVPKMWTGAAPTYELKNQTDTDYDDDALDLYLKLYRKKNAGDIRGKTVQRFFGKVGFNEVKEYYTIKSMEEHIKSQQGQLPLSKDEGLVHQR